MGDFLIAVVNRASARFFTLEPVAFPELQSGPRIKLLAELVNEEIKESREIFSDSKTGRGAAPQGGSIHGYDDKREQHLDELRRRFAIKVLERLQRIAKSQHARTIVVAASVRMRRFLYPEIDVIGRKGYRTHKVSKNMINFSPEKIHEYLAGCDLIPGKA